MEEELNYTFVQMEELHYQNHKKRQKQEEI